MIEACFIVPIYDKEDHFERGIKLLESKQKFITKGDIYFVFTDEEQQQKFRGLTDLSVDSLVIPPELRNYRSPVTVKKFYAIETLQDQYDYIAAMDCETVFVRDFNFAELFESIWNSGQLLIANRSLFGARVNRTCAETINLVNSKKLKEEMNNFMYYWWFNEIPIYKSTFSREFFIWIDENNLREKIYSNFACFDYIIFGMWLIEYKGFRVSKLKHAMLYGMCEDLWRYSNNAKFQRKLEEELQSHWTSIEGNHHNVVLNCQMDKTEVPLSHSSKTIDVLVRYPILLNIFSVKIYSWVANFRSKK